MSSSAYERILENLQFLKSKESLDVLDKTFDQVNQNNLSFIDGFLYFTEAQVEKKKANLISHSVHMAGFPKLKTLTDFDFSFQPSVNQQQIYDLNSLRFIEKQENVVFYGNSGVGKTHLATAIGVTAAQNRKSTYFIKCADLMDILHKAYLEGRLAERLKKLFFRFPVKFRRLFVCILSVLFLADLCFALLRPNQGEGITFSFSLVSYTFGL